MDVQEVIDELKKMPQLEGFSWDTPKDTNGYAFMTLENRHYKDSEKNEYLLGGFYSLFIAHMYKGQGAKEFFYLTLSRPSKFRLFRKHNFEDLDYNEIYASGNSVAQIVNSFKGYFTKCDYTLK